MRDHFLLSCIALSLLWHGLLLLVFPPKVMPAVDPQKRVFVASAYHPRYALAEDVPAARLTFRAVENRVSGPRLVSLPGRSFAEKHLFMENVTELYLPPVDPRPIYEREQNPPNPGPPLAQLPLETAENPSDSEVLFSVEFQEERDKRALVRGPATVEFPEWADKKGREWDAAFRIKVSETGDVVEPTMEGTTGFAELDKLLIAQTGKMVFTPSGQKSEALVRFKFRLETDKNAIDPMKRGE